MPSVGATRKNEVKGHAEIQTPVKEFEYPEFSSTGFFDMVAVVMACECTKLFIGQGRSTEAAKGAAHECHRSHVGAIARRERALNNINRRKSSPVRRREGE